MSDNAKIGFFDRLAQRLDLDDFDKRHKMAFVILVVAAILIMTLWFLQLKKNIVTPLYAGNTQSSLQTNSNTTVQDAATEAELKAKDTDGDGLSDWDEINVYHTSPYLSDSDSDGINDKQEIQQGTDPNCPTGKQCTGTTAPSTNSPTTQNTGTNNSLDGLLSNAVTATASPQVSGTSNSTLTAEEKNALRQTVGTSTDPATLRQILLAAGMDKKTLDAIPDSQLVKTFNDFLK